MIVAKTLKKLSTGLQRCRLSLRYSVTMVRAYLADQRGEFEIAEAYEKEAGLIEEERNKL